MFAAVVRHMLRRQRVRARESFRLGTGMGELSLISPQFAKKSQKSQRANELGRLLPKISEFGPTWVDVLVLMTGGVLGDLLAALRAEPQAFL